VVHDAAVGHLCDELDATETMYPGINLRIVYELASLRIHQEIRSSEFTIFISSVYFSIYRICAENFVISTGISRKGALGSSLCHFHEGPSTRGAHYPNGSASGDCF